MYNSIKINLFQFTLYSLNLVSFDAFQSKVDKFLCWVTEQEAFKKRHQGEKGCENGTDVSNLALLLKK